MRLFVAADLSSEQREALRAKIEEARLAAPFEFVRWLPEENWHATLAFIGDRAESEVPEIEALIGHSFTGISSLKTEPGRIQGFPQRDSPRLLALKLDYEPAIQTLYWRLAEALSLKEQRRDLRLHVTVARFREPDEEAIRELNGAIRNLSKIDSGAWLLPSISLYESTLKQGGAEYRAIKIWHPFVPKS